MGGTSHLAPRRALAFAALAAAGSLWGTGFLFGKVALAEMGVGHMVLYRFLFACIGLLPVLVRHPVRIRRSDVRVFLFAAVIGVPVQFLVQFEGLNRTTVSHASLMVGTMPVLLALGATLFTGERLDRTGWLVLTASTMGAALIAVGARSSGGVGAGPTWQGDLLVIASLTAAVAWVLTSKRLMTTYPPVVATAYVLILGTVFLAAWVFLVDGPPPTTLSSRAWLSLAALGLLSTTSTTLLWNWGLSRVPASEAGVFVNLEPVVGAVLGVGLLHEVLGPLALAGGGLIIGAAIVLAARPDAKPQSRILENGGRPHAQGATEDL